MRPKCDEFIWNMRLRKFTSNLIYLITSGIHTNQKYVGQIGRFLSVRHKEQTRNMLLCVSDIFAYATFRRLGCHAFVMIPLMYLHENTVQHNMLVVESEFIA